MKNLVVFLLKGYKIFISPFLTQIIGSPAVCRYSPTCSEYAILQIKKHGIIVGGYHSIKRLLSCRSW